MGRTTGLNLSARRKKNRGGERLAEWRILRHCSQYKNSRNTKNHLSNVEQLSMPVDTNEEDILQNIPGCSQSLNSVGDLSLVGTTRESSRIKVSLTGRRIVDISHLFNEIKNICEDHSPFDCTFKDMVFEKESVHGLRSCFTFRCQMCGILKAVWSESESEVEMNINASAVVGIMSAGSGFTGLQQVLGAMNIPCMSQSTYSSYHDAVCDGWEKTACTEMKEAVSEEVKFAQSRGDIDQDGIPLLTVVADGSWAKRSYRTNYNSLSGVAAIVGYYTRKVLYIGVKNKYCTICARAQDLTTPNHHCYKNWSKTSTSMEAAILLEGFKLSENMYGVKYARLIADGDSSVYKTLLENRPYDITIEKIECRNHLMRNYCNKIREVVKTSITYTNVKGEKCSTVMLRKKIGSAILRLRGAVTKAVDYRKNEDIPLHLKIGELKKDLLNGPSHVFGEHAKCLERGYFCVPTVKNDANLIPELKVSGLYYKIMSAVGVLVDNASSLVMDVDSNAAEQYNAIVAKFVGGKRINFGP